MQDVGLDEQLVRENIALHCSGRNALTRTASSLSSSLLDLY